MGQEIKFTVPLVPPSVNHYVKHTRNGRHYVTKEAKAFKDALGWMIAAQRLCGALEQGSFNECEVSLRIYLGKGKRGDADNFNKVVLDGLAETGLIRSDAWVKKCTVEKFRDKENPRTEITVRAL